MKSASGGDSHMFDAEQTPSNAQNLLHMHFFSVYFKPTRSKKRIQRSNTK